MGCLAYGSTPCKAGSFGPRVTQKYFTTQFTNQTRQGALGKHISQNPIPLTISPGTISYILSQYHPSTSSRTRKHIKNIIKSPKKVKINKKHHLVQWYEDENQKKINNSPSYNIFSKKQLVPSYQQKLICNFVLQRPGKANLYKT